MIRSGPRDEELFPIAHKADAKGLTYQYPACNIVKRHTSTSHHAHLADTRADTYASHRYLSRTSYRPALPQCRRLGSQPQACALACCRSQSRSVVWLAPALGRGRSFVGADATGDRMAPTPVLLVLATSGLVRSHAQALN